MKTNEKTTVSVTVTTKAAFETPLIEIINFTTDDVIATSAGFMGEDECLE